MHLHGTARMHTISCVGCHVLHAHTHTAQATRDKDGNAPFLWVQPEDEGLKS